MKLIREELAETNFLVEEKQKIKITFIEGVFMQSEIENRNGRRYPKSVMVTEVKRYR
jgi:hypothetical protein